MSYGLQVKNAAGTARLIPEDFVDRLHLRGRAYLTFNSANSLYQTYISVPGMRLDGKWFVSVFGPDFRITVENDGFWILSIDNTVSFTYSVYRR